MMIYKRLVKVVDKMENCLLKSEERLVDLLIDNLKLIQNKNYFCFAIDAVLLANFVKPGNNSRVIELGTATGVIPHLVWSKNQLKEMVGIDIQSELIDLAKRSRDYNKLSDKLKFKQLNLKDAPSYFGYESFDYLISNPPYLKEGSGKVSSNQVRAIARYELETDLAEVVKTSAQLLKYKGKVAYIYRTQRLAELLSLMRANNLEPKRMRIIYHTSDAKAKLFLVEGQKGGNTGVEMLEPLILHKQDGSYTEEIKEIYHPGADING